MRGLVKEIDRLEHEIWDSGDESIQDPWDEISGEILNDAGVDYWDGLEDFELESAIDQAKSLLARSKRGMYESFVLEMGGIPEDQKDKVSQILKSAGYNPSWAKTNGDLSVEVTVDSAGEKRFILNKIVKNGIEPTILQESEDNLEYQKELFTHLLNYLHDHGSDDQLIQWDEWSTGYEFDYDTADAYDFSNAIARLKKIIGK